MAEVFIKRVKHPDSDQLFNVGVTLGKKVTKGDIGIEIEVEGKKLPKAETTPAPWQYHIDHSLRGSDNGEYVLARPIMFSEVDKSIDTLWDSFRKAGSTLDDSNRTSVHIHLNVQGFHLNRLTSFIALYYAVEDILAEWCGEHRVGNLFCLRGRDAPAIVNTLRRFIKTNMQWQIREHHHYAALNANALHKFGSLEIRTLRGVTDPKIIKNWIGMLQRLYDLSASFPDPREICQNFSAQGPMSFFESILGDFAKVIRADVPWSDDEIRAAMYDGVRLAQDLCYCRDWSMFKGVEFKPDPFGRNPKVLLKRMQSQGAGAMDTTAALAAVHENLEPDEDYYDNYDDYNEEEMEGEPGLPPMQPNTILFSPPIHPPGQLNTGANVGLSPFGNANQAAAEAAWLADILNPNT